MSPSEPASATSPGARSPRRPRSVARGANSGHGSWGLSKETQKRHSPRRIPLGP